MNHEIETRPSGKVSELQSGVYVAAVFRTEARQRISGS